MLRILINSQIVFLKSIINAYSLAIIQAKKNFKIKNDGSILGVFWYLLNPIVIFLVLLRVKTYLTVEIENYPFFLFIGLVIFNFIKKGSALIANSLVGGAGFIKNTDLNNLILPLSKLFEVIFSHIFEIIIIFSMMIYYQVNLLNIFLYFLFLIFLCVFIFSLGLVLSIIRLFVFDLMDIWGILMHIFWFLTPIFYFSAGSLVDYLNPFFYFVESGRIMLFGAGNIQIVLIACFISIAMFMLAGLIYENIKLKIAEFV